MVNTKFIITIVGIGAVAFILYKYKSKLTGFFTKASASVTNQASNTTTTDTNTGAPVAQLPEGTTEIYHSIDGANVFDMVDTGFTGLFGGILTERYANFGDIKLTAHSTGKIGYVANDVTVQNLTNDSVKFAVFSQINDSNGFVENIDNKAVTLKPKESKTLNFLQQATKGVKHIDSLGWTSLVNPIPVANKAVTVVTVQ